MGLISAVVLILVLILILVLVLVLILAVVLVLVLILIVHNSLPPNSFLRMFRCNSLPCFSRFILGSEYKACQESGNDCRGDPGSCGF